MAASDLVRVVDLVKEWRTNSSARVVGLRGVSLEVARGERVALLGKSGSGKSTLLNILGGLDRPTSGCVEVFGENLSRSSSDALARYRLTRVGMVFQSFHLVSSLSALRNVELPLIFAGLAPQKRHQFARRALESVGLAERAGHRPTQLSGGEQQRVAIARALVNEPQLILADEPVGNLDSENAQAVMEILDVQVTARQATLILVTHDEDLARRWTSRVVRLRDGEVARE